MQKLITLKSREGKILMQKHPEHLSANRTKQTRRARLTVHGCRHQRCLAPSYSDKASVIRRIDWNQTQGCLELSQIYSHL